MGHAVFEELGFETVWVNLNAGLFDVLVEDCGNDRVCMDFCFEMPKASVFVFWEEVTRIDLAANGRLGVRMYARMLRRVLLTALDCLWSASDLSVYRGGGGGRGLMVCGGCCMYHGDAAPPRA